MDQTLQGFAPQLRGPSSPELRKDPIVGRWVIIAPERAQRPVAATAEPELADGSCPFCEGSEVETPHEVLALRAADTEPDQPGWRVRVVPNKFPALRAAGDYHARREGLYDRLDAVGSHEVLIECPHHETSLAALSEENIGEVLQVYRARMLELKTVPSVAYGTVFKNSGAAAGASLAHTHSQLIATPIVPINILEELAGAMEHFHAHSRCIFCDLIQQELACGVRVILDTPHFVCVAPFASRFSFETWILPKRHRSHYEDLDEVELRDLGHVLKSTLTRIEIALNRPAYNYIIHTAPFDVAALPHYHWHLEILPRLGRVAGFEWGTGFCINAVPPEQAAEFLRGIESGEKPATDETRTKHG